MSDEMLAKAIERMEGFTKKYGQSPMEPPSMVDDLRTIIAAARRTITAPDRKALVDRIDKALPIWRGRDSPERRQLAIGGLLADCREALSDDPRPWWGRFIQSYIHPPEIALALAPDGERCISREQFEAIRPALLRFADDICRAALSADTAVRQEQTTKQQTICPVCGENETQGRHDHSAGAAPADTAVRPEIALAVHLGETYESTLRRGLENIAQRTATYTASEEEMARNTLLAADAICAAEMRPGDCPHCGAGLEARRWAVVDENGPTTTEEVANLIRLGLRRYQDSGDTLARKSAWMLESLQKEVGWLRTKCAGYKLAFTNCCNGSAELERQLAEAQARSSWAFVLAALIKEQKRSDHAGEMFPQVAEEQRESHRAMSYAIASVRWAMKRGMPLPTTEEVAAAVKEEERKS